MLFQASFALSLAAGAGDAAAGLKAGLLVSLSLAMHAEAEIWNSGGEFPLLLWNAGTLRGL